MLATSLLTALFLAIVFIKNNTSLAEEMASDSSQRSFQFSTKAVTSSFKKEAIKRGLKCSHEDDVGPLPFETFGVTLISSLGLGPTMRSLGPLVHMLAASVEERLLVLSICLPCCLYYFMSTLLARLRLGRIADTPDEWLLVMAAFFLIGR